MYATLQYATIIYGGRLNISGEFDIYSKEDKTSIPTNDDNLSHIYTNDEKTNVGTNDEVYVDQESDNFAIHQFKDVVETSSATIEWNGQSDLAATSKTIYLQIYNRNTSSWETKDSNSTVNANTDFTLTATISDLTNYKDGNNVISCRVYQ
jgi:hypothetical protein